MFLVMVTASYSRNVIALCDKKNSLALFELYVNSSHGCALT